MAFSARAVPPWNRALGFLAIGIGLAAISTVLILSIDPNNYFYYWPSQMADWKYPTRGVLLTVLEMTAETALVYAVLAKYSRGRLWMRGVGALALLIPLAGYNLMFIVHSPIFHGIHVMYALAAALIVFIMTVCSGAMHLWQKVAPRIQGSTGHA